MISAQPTETPYALAGANLGPFATVWFFEQASDVRVLLDDGDGVLTVLGGGSYALTAPTPLTAGGTVLLSAALLTDGAWPDNARVVLQRAQPIDQSSAFGEGYGFSPLAAEDALDHVAREVQQLGTQLGRAILLTPGETAIALPGPTARALGVLTFDADGEPLIAALPIMQALSAEIAASGLTLVVGGSFVFATAEVALQAYLPALDTVAVGQWVDVCDGDDNAGTNTVTLTAQGADTIEFQQQAGTVFPLAVNSARARFVSRGSYWRVIV